jgi:hypothetical protein
MNHLEKSLTDRPHFHCPGRAGWDAQFAHAAFLLIENNFHLRPLDPQRTRWAHSRAGAALGADRFIAFDFSRSVLYINALGFEVVDTFPEIFAGSGQLQHHVAFFAWQDSRIEYIENQVVIAGQVANNRLLDLSHRKTKNQYF